MHDIRFHNETWISDNNLNILVISVYKSQRYREFDCLGGDFFSGSSIFGNSLYTGKNRKIRIIFKRALTLIFF